MKPLRCAVIGCGRIGCGFDETSNLENPRTHAGSYFKNPNTRLVALCDVDEQKLEKYGKKFQVSNLYTSVSEMFKKENLDCISICTLLDTHLKLVKEAVNHNIKGIFLEKPVSDSLENANNIIQICKKNKIQLVVDHQRRFDPFYHSVRDFIHHNSLGKIQLVNVYYGSGIANTCSHVFDVLRMFFGEIKYVKATQSSNKSNNKFDPNLDVKLEFTNNMMCNLQALDTKYYGMLEMDIFGTSGRLKLDLAKNNAEFFKISEKDFLVYKNLIPSKINLSASKKSSISLGVQNLVKSILGKETPMCTGNDGYKSLELIIASIKSSNERKVMKLPLSRNSFKIKSK